MTYFPTEPSEIYAIFNSINSNAQNPRLLAQDMDIWIDATKGQLASYGEIYAGISDEINSTSDAIHYMDLAENHDPAAYFVDVLVTACSLKEGLWAAGPETEMEIKRLRDKVLIAASVINFPLADRGVKFTGRKPGKLKITEVLDREIQEVLAALGPDAEFKDIMAAIEQKAENEHEVFQEVCWETETVYIKGPDGTQEKTRKFNTIRNTIARLKKIMQNKK